MFGNFMPREGKFFDYFNKHAGLLIEGAAELRALLAHPDNGLEGRVRKVEAVERRADEVTHETINLLHHTFITPLDRDHIHQLITGLDTILDLMEDVAQSIHLYDVHELTPECQKLGEQIEQGVNKVQEAVKLLPNMDNALTILKLCQDIDRIEGEADHVMRSGMAKLFREETDTKQLIKLKAVYELLETTTDRCADVANVIEGIVLENA
ncbi:DUF47 domain-containing protein [Permianibacter sp. IMCC34836]|uniref:DUF47 domain-containing protein n=1 Tax=Permianibacter fluminis TaxID=2738515 RepID=UPI001557EF32|nr:DUF47 domain-containing protein [Permianibacter fluminis]NQD38225.1 DUF47 domain-containing protein [Permianibacter fluminis]